MHFKYKIFVYSLAFNKPTMKATYFRPQTSLRPFQETLSCEGAAGKKKQYPEDNNALRCTGFSEGGRSTLHSHAWRQAQMTSKAI